MKHPRRAGAAPEGDAVDGTYDAARARRTARGRTPGCPARSEPVVTVPRGWAVTTDRGAPTGAP